MRAGRSRGAPRGPTRDFRNPETRFSASSSADRTLRPVMKSSRSLVPVVLVSTVLGAGVAVGAVALFGLGGGSTTTVVRQTAVADGTPASNPTSSSLTPAQLYKR